MNKDAVLNEFRAAGALLEGHFLLSSGRHSAVYLQCARVLMSPLRAARLCAELARRVKDRFGEVPLVVSPAMGGVIVGYETARQLGADAQFVERVGGQFHFRRGFAIKPGERIVMVEDVVTTGLSSRECIRAIRSQGGHVIAAACLIDRSNGTADVGVPLIALAQIDAPSYAPDDVPENLARMPAVKPGSRGLS